MDTVARAVVSGRRGQGAYIDRLADHVAGLMRNRLDAAGATAALRVRRSPTRKRAARLPDRRVLDLLIERVGKHLAAVARDQGGDAGSHAR